MEFKGTSGKWKQNGFSVYVGDKEHINSNVICRFHTGLEDYQSKQKQYNALLISKAPEMLEMLKELKNRLEYYNDNVSVNQIEQLITEATELK